MSYNNDVNPIKSYRVRIMPNVGSLSNAPTPLRELRVRKGYERVEQLAVEMGCSAGTLNTWELRGGVTDTVHFFKNLADSLDISMDDLYTYLTKDDFRTKEKSAA